MILDEFYDVIFEVENSFIKGNSLILQARSLYFRKMFSRENKFNEIQDQKIIQIKGIKKKYFVNII